MSGAGSTNSEDTPSERRGRRWRAEPARLELEDGTIFPGFAFGARRSSAGEVVFNTGMVGYQESLTDPSYCGQILAFTYPLIGNYGVPSRQADHTPLGPFESDRVQVAGAIVSEHSVEFSHHSAVESLDAWLSREGVPALFGIDTRALTKHLRSRGSLLGKLLIGDEQPPLYDPNQANVLPKVSSGPPRDYGSGERTVLLVDCGTKNSIITSLIERQVRVRRVPWDYNFLQESFDGIVISNGPGDPAQATLTSDHLRAAFELGRPMFGICLGHQLLARAAGAQTYKLPFGHRSQNQPVIEQASQRCFMSSQNHGFAVENTSVPSEWALWFINANDGSNEGLRHRSKPFMSVQFHPEAVPGPVDTNYLFDEFVSLL